MFQGLKMKRKITFHLPIAKERKEIGRGGRGLYLLVLNHPSLCSELFFSTFTSWRKSIFELMLTSAFVVTFNSVYFQLVFLHHRFSSFISLL